MENTTCESQTPRPRWSSFGIRHASVTASADGAPFPTGQERLAVECRVDAGGAGREHSHLNAQAIDAAVGQFLRKHFGGIGVVFDMAPVERIQSVVGAPHAPFSIAGTWPDRQANADLSSAIQSGEGNVKIVAAVDGHRQHEPGDAAADRAEFLSVARPLSRNHISRDIGQP